MKYVKTDGRSIAKQIVSGVFLALYVLFLIVCAIVWCFFPFAAVHAFQEGSPTALLFLFGAPLWLVGSIVWLIDAYKWSQS